MYVALPVFFDLLERIFLFDDEIQELLLELAALLDRQRQEKLGEGLTLLFRILPRVVPVNQILTDLVNSIEGKKSNRLSTSFIGL